MKEYEYVCIYDDITYKICVGESAQENWDLINDSSQNDIWFHVKDCASCHVVLKTNECKKYPHKSVIKYCAILCKEGSKLKLNKNISITYTEIKNVKKLDKIGSVTTKNIRIIKI